LPNKNREAPAGVGGELKKRHEPGSSWEGVVTRYRRVIGSGTPMTLAMMDEMIGNLRKAADQELTAAVVAAAEMPTPKPRARKTVTKKKAD
jgi:hypothetical protein